MTVVDDRSGEKGEGDAVDNDRLATPLENQIIFGRVVEPDVVLEARATAALDRHAQRLRRRGARIDLGDPLEGTFGHTWRQCQGHRLHVSNILPEEYKGFGTGAQGCALHIGTMMAARYATDPARSRGRLYFEPESAFRSCYQRDRDRIIHSSAFRRLKHKTQVFVEHEGDYYRTRLTHSIEVAQVARTIARTLDLDSDLTEAVALAHDLGHTPFGHTGEDALNALMKPYGGFDHNAQTIRIVTSLERHYAGFDGINCTWETLEGIAKHNGPVVGELPMALAEYNALQDLELGTHAGPEAQVAALSDDIAYNNHDLLDGLRAGLFSEADIAQLPLLAEANRAVDAAHPSLEASRRRHEILRRVFGFMVEDVIATSQKLIGEADPSSVEDIRALGYPVIQFSEEMTNSIDAIREFLFENMYRAPSVMEKRASVTRVVEELFPIYMERPELLPSNWNAPETAKEGDTALARLVADYIAGMTDRFALTEHERLFR